jgi:predicted O-methyltransferase YrrM
MDIDEVTRRLGDTPGMPPNLGRVVYDHLREQRATDVLELGTANGRSAAYMAAALEANGSGRVTTVDHVSADYRPTPDETLSKAGLADRVRIVRTDASSYTWWLKNEIAAASDADGNCQPQYDFCYLDGSHDWTVDGFAALLVEKLLRPGGWLLLDDLDWTFEGNETREQSEGIRYPLSSEERTQPHMRAVFDLLLRQHPSFTEFREQDLDWGWAKKAPGEPRRYEVVTARPPGALITQTVLRAGRRILRARRSR